MPTTVPIVTAAVILNRPTDKTRKCTSRTTRHLFSGGQEECKRLEAYLTSSVSKATSRVPSPTAKRVLTILLMVVFCIRVAVMGDSYSVFFLTGGACIFIWRLLYVF
jgi:hypothetical protein